MRRHNIMLIRFLICCSQLADAARFFLFVQICTSDLEESCTGTWITQGNTDNTQISMSVTKPDLANPGQYIIDYTALSTILPNEEDIRFLMIEVRYGSSPEIAVPIRGPTDVESSNGEFLRSAGASGIKPIASSCLS